MLLLFAPIARHFRHKARRRVTLLVAWVVLYVSAAQTAHAKTSPDGLGGLIQIPNLAKGQAKTLQEAYGPARYEIFQDLGKTDIVAGAVYPIYAALNEVCYALTKLTVGLTYWQQTSSERSLGTGAIGRGIEATSSATAEWLLPSTLAVGATIAWAMAKRGDQVFSQLAAMLVIAGVAVGMAYHGKEAVSAIDDTRVATAKLVNYAGVSAIEKQNEPFKFRNDPDLTAETPHAAERKAGDVVWRQFYVTPWCQLQFGSQAACKAYADKWLATAGYEKRKDYLEGGIVDAEGGDAESGTPKYIKGKIPGTRVGVSLLAVVLAAGGAIVQGGLAFFAFLPWQIALLMMFLGVFFLCMMVIPGFFRDAGRDWWLTIAGQTFFSAICAGLLAGMLLLMIQASKLSATDGYLLSMLYTCAALGAAWFVRKVLQAKLTGSSSSGMGGALLGGLLLGRMASRMGRSLRAHRAGRGRGGGRPGGGGSETSGGGSRGNRAEQIAQRAGQIGGAARHPITAARRGGSSARGYFQARSQAGRERMGRVRDAAKGGYQQTSTPPGPRRGGTTSGAADHRGRRQGGDERNASVVARDRSGTDRPGRTREGDTGHARPSRRGEHGATAKNLPPRQAGTGRHGGRAKPRPSRAGGKRGTVRQRPRREEQPGPKTSQEHASVGAVGGPERDRRPRSTGTNSRKAARPPHRSRTSRQRRNRGKGTA